MSGFPPRSYAWIWALLLLTPVSVFCGIKGAQKLSLDSTNDRMLHANQIAIAVNSRGLLADLDYGEGAWHYDPTNEWGDFMAPIVCDQGPWIIGKINGVLSAGIAYWGSSYMPGPVINGRPALHERPQDSLRYHPYRLDMHSSVSDQDYLSWPSDLGAPLGPTGSPLLLGDEMVWSVFNGVDSSAYPSDWTRGSLRHLPVEIRQTVYAHARPADDVSALANTVFMEWMLINGGKTAIESCYVGLWTDIDFDDMQNNFPAVDTSLQMGYCWDGPLSVGRYPAAVGYLLLFGPMVPDASSDATFLGRSRPGYKNLPLSSFWGIIMDAGLDSQFIAGPNNISASWNVARGYDKTGGVIIDSVTRVPTQFPYSGDPITGSGWVYDNIYRKGSEGFLMFSGPFNFAPGDTQWVMTALIAALDSNRIQSIRTLREHAAGLRTMSYNDIASPRALSIAQPPELPVAVSLFQNFPNPFNPSTTISYMLPGRLYVKVSVIDMLGRVVAVLQDGEQPAGYQRVNFNARAVSSGVYFCRLQTEGGVLTNKMMVLR